MQGQLSGSVVLREEMLCHLLAELSRGWQFREMPEETCSNQAVPGDLTEVTVDLAPTKCEPNT